MNKRGNEYVMITGAELVFLVVFASVFGYISVKGVDEYKVNQIRAEDLSLAINSVFILNNNINLNYNFGDERNVEFSDNNIRIYRFSKSKIGVSGLSLDAGYNFAEQVSEKTKTVSIVKDKKRVIVN